MKLLIWGAGAIGGTIGAHLARAGHDVTFVDRAEDHVAAINRMGLRIEGPLAQFVAKAPAFLPDDIAGEFEHVVLAVKAQDTADATGALAPHLRRDGYVVSAQNGLNELVIKSIVGEARTMGCFVNFGADYIEPGVIQYAGRGAVVLGEIDGRVTPRIGEMHRAFRDFDDAAIVTTNIWGYLWGKLAYGAQLFATALTNDSIADALADPKYRDVYVEVAREVMRVARARDITPEGFNGFDPHAFAPDAAREVAERVAARLREAGPIDIRTIATGGHPVVYGEWLGADGAPTLLVYGHYDVQPPDPLERWSSDPFGPEVREGRLYGRGVSDNKGPMLIPLKVAQAFFATRGALPLNVKFLFEGEEEIGSRNLEPMIAANAGLLRADVVLSADGAMWRSDEPSITVGCRGVSVLEFTLTGANRNLHSGRYGGSIANALHAMAETVASLHAPDGRVAVPGFYDDVVPLNADERRAIADLGFDEAGFLSDVGAPAAFGEARYCSLGRQWGRPTLEVNGMWGGFQGEGSQTVTPNEAHAKLSCRLVPDPDPDRVRALVARHLEIHVPVGVTLSLGGDRHSAMPYRIPSDHPGLLTAERVLEQVYGKEPLRVRMGSTLPVSELFKRLLGIDTVFFSFSTTDEDFHSPNEFFRVRRLHEGLEAWARSWERYARRSEQ